MRVETKLHTFITSEVAANIPNLHNPLGETTHDMKCQGVNKMFPINMEIKTPATLRRVNETTS